MLLIKNANYLSPAGEFNFGHIGVAKDKIVTVSITPLQERDYATVIDAKGLRVIPGLIDIHTHGGVGVDIMEADPSQIACLTNFYARHGVTSFMPTTMTSNMEDLYKACARISEAAERPELGASIDGVHIEGPYINPLYKGCHDTKYIKAPDFTEFSKLREILGSRLKITVTLAPEMLGAMEFIHAVCEIGDKISIGHSGTDYQTTVEALAQGANRFTHLFNAMQGIKHREPGTVVAALLSDAYVELICDGLHLAPEILQMTLKLKSIDKIILVTDSMQATGMADGTYSLGGLSVQVKNGEARLEDGTLAGSTLELWQAVRNFASFTGLPLMEAVRAATINPAKAMGIDGLTGSIAENKRADLAILDDRDEIVYTVCRGKVVYQGSDLHLE